VLPFHLVDDFKHSIGNWDPVGAVVFHSLRWNRPDAVPEIKLCPLRTAYLSVTKDRQDYQFSCSCSYSIDAVELAKRSPSFDWSGSREGDTGTDLLGQQLVEVSSPARGVLSLAQLSSLGSVQDQLDSVSHAPCCDRDFQPDRFEDLKNIVGVDIGRAHGTDHRKHVVGERVLPLLSVFLAPGRSMGRNVSTGFILKCHAVTVYRFRLQPLLSFLGLRVCPFSDLQAVLIRGKAGFLQPHTGIGANGQVEAITAETVAKKPSFCPVLSNLQNEPTAITV